MNAPGLFLQHVNIMVDDIDAADRFYADVLGLERDATPALGFPAQFFRLGPDQQLHVNQLADQPPHRAHFALRVEDFNGIFRRCHRAGVIDTEPWGPVKRIPGGMWQAFVRDPSGNLVEIASQPNVELDADIADLEIVES